MFKYLLLAGVLALAPINGASAQGLQLPNLGEMLQDSLNPGRNDGQRDYDNRRAEQDRRDAYQDGREDGRRAYEERARRDYRADNRSWSRGRDRRHRGRGNGKHR